jgi:putative transposase
MRENGLNARPKRRFKRTTDSYHAFPIALIDQDFSAERPNHKWTAEGWLYLKRDDFRLAHIRLKRIL